MFIFAGPLAQQRRENRCCIQLARTEKLHEACKPTSQCLRKCLIEAESLILQPQTQDDERVGCSVEFAVETGDETITPENRQRVITEFTLGKRLVDLPHI